MFQLMTLTMKAQLQEMPPATARKGSRTASETQSRMIIHRPGEGAFRIQLLPSLKWELINSAIGSGRTQMLRPLRCRITPLGILRILRAGSVTVEAHVLTRRKDVGSWNLISVATPRSMASSTKSSTQCWLSLRFVPNQCNAFTTGTDPHASHLQISAMTFLLYTIIAYWLGFQLFAIILWAPYFSSGKFSEAFSESSRTSKTWHASPFPWTETMMTHHLQVFRLPKRFLFQQLWPDVGRVSKACILFIEVSHFPDWWTPHSPPFRHATSCLCQPSS